MKILAGVSRCLGSRASPNLCWRALVTRVGTINQLTPIPASKKRQGIFFK